MSKRRAPKRPKSPCFSLRLFSPVWTDGSEWLPEVGTAVTVNTTELLELPDDFPEMWVRDGHLIDGVVHSRGYSSDGEPWLCVVFTDAETLDSMNVPRPRGAVSA